MRLPVRLVRCLYAFTVIAAISLSPQLATAQQPTSSVPQLDSAKVPADLRVLIPYAQEWGIGDDGDRADKEDQASRQERERLREAVKPYQQRITAWLDSFGSRRMSREAAAFMYMQLAIEEMISK